MQLLNKYQGTVFFVDILGIGALTKNQIKLESSDFDLWLNHHNLEHNNQYLAAALLAEFREILIELQNEFENVKFSQLSDCAFIWSESTTDVIIVAQNFMTRAIKRGILCRGGMSFGEIIETQKDHRIGRFIVGEAVTNAVKLESTSKGARVLIDENLPNQFWREHESFAQKLSPIFSEFTNPLDFNIYDEFKWYLIPHLGLEIGNLETLSKDEKLNYTKERLKLASEVRVSPKFNWNTKSKEGLVQMNATMNILTENNLLGLSHNFDWKNVVTEKRTANIVENLKLIIDAEENYKFIEINNNDIFEIH